MVANETREYVHGDVTERMYNELVRCRRCRAARRRHEEEDQMEPPFLYILHFTARKKLRFERLGRGRVEQVHILWFATSATL